MSLQTEPACHPQTPEEGEEAFLSILDQELCCAYWYHTIKKERNNDHLLCISYKCVRSIHRYEYCAPHPSKKKKRIKLTFINSQMTTNPASKNFFCKRWILFHSDSLHRPFEKGTAPDFVMRHFPGAAYLPPLAAGWWKLNWTVLLFTMRKSKPFPLDMVKERCEQLTEIILWPGRSHQVLISSCEP